MPPTPVERRDDVTDDDPQTLKQRERSAFYESLAPAAKERFLDALENARTQGLDDEGAWREAVVAAETTYGPPPARTNDEGNL